MSIQNTNYEYEPLSTKSLQVQKATTLIYKKLINNKSLTPESSQKKWIENCCLPTNDNINWTAAYVLAKKCTKSTKLIEFQYKFLHRRIPMNNFLFRIGAQATENCSFCQTSTESLIHLFWSCDKTSYFWNEFTGWLQNLNLLPKDYTDKCYCFGSEARGFSICTSDQLPLPLSTISHMACSIKRKLP